MDKKDNEYGVCFEPNRAGKSHVQKFLVELARLKFDREKFGEKGAGLQLWVDENPASVAAFDSWSGFRMGQIATFSSEKNMRAFLPQPTLFLAPPSSQIPRLVAATQLASYYA